ncbi:MAG: hypothetical protein U0L08_04550 [Bacteroidales bacterium]|nr:hypothetical protein [Bacteroidales bacterium]
MERKISKQELEIENQITEIANKISSADTEAIYDGVFDLELYKSSPIRLMYVLKEAYDEFDDQNNAYGGGYSIPRDCFIKNDAGNIKTWQPIIYTTYALFNGLKYNDMDYICNDKSMTDVLKQIAYINTNKMPRQKTSDDSLISKAYNTWKPVLMRQIDFYNPQVIIFCGTFKFYKADLVGVDTRPIHTSQSNSLSVYRKENGALLLDTYHPNQRSVKHEIYVNDILNAIKEFLNK